jgi:hypothetical protein
MKLRVVTWSYDCDAPEGCDSVVEWRQGDYMERPEWRSRLIIRGSADADRAVRAQGWRIGPGRNPLILCSRHQEQA